MFFIVIVLIIVGYLVIEEGLPQLLAHREKMAQLKNDKEKK